MKTEYSEGNIKIRPYIKSDIDLLYTAAKESISEVYQWLPWCHPQYKRDDSVRWVKSRKRAWKSETEYSFVIMDISENKFLGGVGINEINKIHNFANLGYWVRTGETGRGIATIATILTARFAFEQIKLERIEILTAINNKASQRVAEKAGAKKEGILRNRLLINGTYHDAVIFSLVKSDLNDLPK